MVRVRWCHFRRLIIEQEIIYVRCILRPNPPGFFIYLLFYVGLFLLLRLNTDARGWAFTTFLGNFAYKGTMLISPPVFFITCRGQGDLHLYTEPPFLLPFEKSRHSGFFLILKNPPALVGFEPTTSGVPVERANRYTTSAGAIKMKYKRLSKLCRMTWYVIRKNARECRLLYSKTPSWSWQIFQGKLRMAQFQISSDGKRDL